MKFIPLFAAFISLGSASLTHAATGTRGGGQSIEVNGRPSLKDLVDKTTCRWTPATQLQAQLPELKGLMSRLGEIHWYYPSLFSSAARELTVCMTQGSLSQIDTIDQDGLTIGEENGRQVAIRWDDKIYIDRKIFERMDDQNKAYLFFHEVIHSFIPIDISQRNIKLRSFVNSVREYANGNLSAQEFMQQLKPNNVDWPQVSQLAPIQSLRETFERLHASDPVLQDVGASQLESMRKLLLDRGAISNRDANLIYKLSQNTRDHFAKALENCDLSLVQKYIERLPSLKDFQKADGANVELISPDAQQSLVVSYGLLYTHHVLGRLLRQSDANIKLGLNDESCANTLSFILDNNLRVGFYDKQKPDNNLFELGYFTPNPFPRKSFDLNVASQIQVTNPRIWTLLTTFFAKEKEEHARQKSAYEQQQQQKRKEEFEAEISQYLERCAPDAECVLSTLQSIDQELYYDEALNGTQSISYSSAGKIENLPMNRALDFSRALIQMPTADLRLLRKEKRSFRTGSMKALVKEFL